MTAALPKESKRAVLGCTLHQNQDEVHNIENAQVVTKKTPTTKELLSLNLAFRLSIPARSNAITITNSEQLLGIGSGQTSRVDAVQIAIWKAEQQK